MYEEIRKNKQNTLLIVGSFALFIAMVCAVIGHFAWESALLGAALGVLAGSLYTALSLKLSEKTLLRLSNAKRLTKYTAKTLKEKQLVNITSQLAMMAEITEPDLYVIEDDLPNAFATGFSPEKAAVAVTTGLVERLNRSEIEGVLAHEVAHIRNYDTRLKLTVFALGGFLVGIGEILSRSGRYRSSSRNNSDNDGSAILMLIGVLIVLFGTLVSKLIQLCVSRNREYLADATAVELTRNPQSLISALEKISRMEASDVADNALASMYFVNPFKKERDSLWSTHPTTKNRITKLNEL